MSNNDNQNSLTDSNFADDNLQNEASTGTADNVELTATAYNDQASQEIEAWMNPDSNILTNSLSALSAPIDKAGEAIMESPHFGDTLKEAVEKTLTTFSDAANWSIDEQEILKAYNEQSDQTIETIADIQKLDLQTVDKQVNLFKSKYVAASSAQGVTTGMAGWAGIPADIAGIIAANLRAIAEFATYYGFDVDKKEEQLFAISLLSIATSTSAEDRQAAVDQSLSLLKDPETMAFNKVNEEVASRVVRQTATKVATDMVKTKAAQVVPAVGALVAGGVNANYTAKVCEAAYQCYRQRFLDRQSA